MIEIESNDTILLANLNGELGDESGVITGDIDDTDDVDLFEIELRAGETIFADINAEIDGFDLDSVLSIFDAEGNLLVQNEDNSFEVDGEVVIEADAFQQFTAFADGLYYVGVSASGNLDYDPSLAGSGEGDSTGSYNLSLSIGEFTVDEQATEANDILSLANIIDLDELEESSPIIIAGEIGDNSTQFSPEDDVDLFEIELTDGDVINADIDAAIIGSDLNAVLSVFDSNGDLLVQSNDNSFESEAETITELDPFLQFLAPEDGTYFIGVSSFGNLEYDPTVLDSGADTGESIGLYNLALSFAEEIFDQGEEVVELPETIDELAAEANDLLDLANSVDLDEIEESSSLTITGEIGDNSTLSEPEDDVDLFELELAEGDVINVDINAAIFGSELDPVLSIFDINGDLLIQNNDNSFESEGETITELDPFLQFIAPEDGTYFVGVSSFGNLEYDPTVLDSGANTGESVGFYNLVLSFGEEIFGEELEDIEMPDAEVDGNDSSGGVGDVIPDDDMASSDPSDDGVTNIFDILDLFF